MNYKFPSISVFKEAKKYFNLDADSLEFIIKPKLHGTNASIVFHNDFIRIFSKNKELSEHDNNYEMIPKNYGNIIKAVLNDVYKENTDDISLLDKKRLNSAMSKKIVSFLKLI